LARRIALEAFIFGPLYISSLLWWTTTFKTGDIMNGFNCIYDSAFCLYVDALKVVPAYTAFTYFAIAPHMRGYSLTAFQFVWNVYVAWFVDDASEKFSRPPPTSLLYTEHPPEGPNVTEPIPAMSSVTVIRNEEK
jgi:hypothetical protein